MTRPMASSSTTVGRRPWTANYRSRELKQGVVITASHGAWAMLRPVQFRALENGRPSRALLALLEGKGLVRSRRNCSRLDELLDRWCSPYFQGTSLHIVVTTHRCNLRCAYCHAATKPEHDRGGDLQPAVAERIADFILSCPKADLTVEFQGGESLLNFGAVRHMIEYIEARQRAVGKRVEFRMVSNLVLLNPEVAEYAREHHVALCTSLDGTREMHDLHRVFPDGTGSYALVREKIDLARAGGHRVGLLSVVTASTMESCVAAVDAYADLGIDTVCLNPVQRLGRAAESWSDLGIHDVDRFLELYVDVLDHTFERLRRGKFIMDRMFLIGLSKLTGDSDSTFMDFRSPCGAVIGQLVYDIDGSIFPCDEARSIPALKLGSVFEHQYREILGTPLTQTIVDASIHESQACMACAYRPYCGLCPVVTYAESGQFRREPLGTLRCRFTIVLFDYLFAKIASAPEELAAVLRYQAARNALLAAEQEELVGQG